MGFMINSVLALVVGNVVLSALVGRLIALRAGVEAWKGALPGALLPWLGLLVPVAALARQARVAELATARRGTGAAGIVALFVAGGLLFASNFVEWFSVSGDAVGLRAGFVGASGRDVNSALLVVVLAVLLVGLGVLAWLRGGIGTVLTTGMVTTAVASMVVLAVAISALAMQVAGQIQNASSGLLHLSAIAGPGLWLAYAGCIIGFVGAVLLSVRKVVPLADGAAAIVSGQPQAPRALDVDRSQTRALPADGWTQTSSGPPSSPERPGLVFPPPSSSTAEEW